jgi:PIN domain nuclease of toxin-antitoxin system
MSGVVADTHALVWLLFAPQHLSPKALAALQGAVQAGAPIYVAAISLVEIIYLVERGRLSQAVLLRMISEFNQPNSGLVMVPLDFAIAQAVQQILRTDVPEMPDRIIAATAHYLGLPLITRDHKIRSANLTTIW